MKVQVRLMGERSSCLNFNQRASEWAATGDTKHLSVMKPCIHSSLSTLRKTLVAPCLLIRAVYLSSPSLATVNTGAMETCERIASQHSNEGTRPLYAV